MKQIRVILADDHGLLRAGLKALIETMDGIEVVGEASDGRTALSLVKQLLPDVLLTDISMPMMSGLEVAERVASEAPNTKTIIISMHQEKEYATKALRAGAMGYLVKDASPKELELAIRAVARGESYLSSTISGHVVAEYNRLAEANQAGSNPLSPRQREVLKLIAKGQTTKAIARELRISVKTAEAHRLQIMERLGIHDVAGLVKYAIRAGIAKIDS